MSCDIFVNTIYFNRYNDFGIVSVSVVTCQDSMTGQRQPSVSIYRAIIYVVYSFRYVI
jgi:hypothetical protein